MFDITCCNEAAQIAVTHQHKTMDDNILNQNILVFCRFYKAAMAGTGLVILLS
jgi:hypothetical protein